jgi:hypothetical protein
MYIRSAPRVGDALRSSPLRAGRMGRKPATMPAEGPLLSGTPAREALLIRLANRHYANERERRLAH